LLFPLNCNPTGVVIAALAPPLLPPAAVLIMLSVPWCNFLVLMSFWLALAQAICRSLAYCNCWFPMSVVVAYEPPWLPLLEEA
jgi:hypothetical protein